MRLRSIRLRRVQGKRILLRCDLNVSPRSGSLGPFDLWKLKSIVPSIRSLRNGGGAIILVSHRGRPKGYDHGLSLRPVARALSALVRKPVAFWSDSIDAYAARSRTLTLGQVVCLENIRFHRGEETNSSSFAKQLARCADIYVNDAFANIHRTHASMVAITRYLPSYAGLLMEHEVSHLHNLLHHAAKPIVAVMGGNKISTKIRLIKKLLLKVEWLLMGGALANNVLAAMDYKIGRSMVEEEMISWSRGILHNKLKVPLDARVASSLHASKTRIAAIGAVRKHEMILDLGPDTVAFYAQIIRRAKTVIWNGPLGYFEDPRFGRATRDLVGVVAKANARAYVGGGETVKAVLEAHLEKKMHFISTGGGAMLSVLEGRPLPALRALMK